MIEKLFDLIEWWTKPSHFMSMAEVIRRVRIKAALRWAFIGILIGFSLGYCMRMSQLDAQDNALRESFHQRRMAR